MNEDQAIERLRQNGYKITPQREEILKAFGGACLNAPQSAEDIHQAVVAKHPNVSLDTVYRNLNILHDLEIICRIHLQDGKSRYQMGCGEHHHHLICLKCGKSDAIEFCPLRSTDRQMIAREKHFQITKHSFEIFGYCEDCRHDAIIGTSAQE